MKFPVEQKSQTNDTQANIIMEILQEFNGAEIFGDLFNQVKQGNEEAIKEVGRRLLKPAAFQIRSSHPRDLDEFFDACGLKDFWDGL
jgi:hypothetical protein